MDDEVEVVDEMAVGALDAGGEGIEDGNKDVDELGLADSILDDELGGPVSSELSERVRETEAVVDDELRVGSKLTEPEPKVMLALELPSGSVEVTGVVSDDTTGLLAVGTGRVGLLDVEAKDEDSESLEMDDAPVVALDVEPLVDIPGS